MCDPLSLGLAALSAVGSIGGALAQQSQAQDFANKQNQANEQWVAYQQKIHQDEATAQDQARNAANQAREQTLKNVSPDAQAQAQQAEQARLNTTYQGSSATGTGRAGPGVNAATVAPYALSGETTGVGAAPGQNQATMNSLASQINTATGQARSRISNLATANSYGGSFGGLGTVVPIAFQQGANQINLENEIRKSDLQTYGVEQQVQPIRYAVGPGAGTMGGIATALAGMAGKLGGSAAAGAWGGAGGGGGGTGAVSVPNFDDVSAGMDTMGWGFT